MVTVTIVGLLWIFSNILDLPSGALQETEGKIWQCDRYYFGSEPTLETIKRPAVPTSRHYVPLRPNKAQMLYG